MACVLCLMAVCWMLLIAIPETLGRSLFWKEITLEFERPRSAAPNHDRLSERIPPR